MIVVLIIIAVLLIPKATTSVNSGYKPGEYSQQNRRQYY
jgi:hypothetical protein